MKKVGIFLTKGHGFLEFLFLYLLNLLKLFECLSLFGWCPFLRWLNLINLFGILFRNSICFFSRRGVVRRLEEVISPRVLAIVDVWREGRVFDFLGF